MYRTQYQMHRPSQRKIRMNLFDITQKPCFGKTLPTTGKIRSPLCHGVPDNQLMLHCSCIPECKNPSFRFVLITRQFLTSILNKRIMNGCSNEVSGT